MRHVAACITLPFLLVVLLSACSAENYSTRLNSNFIQNITGRSAVAEPPANKLWEGDIDGAQVSYFRSRSDGGFKNVVVVTRDRLPSTFRKVDYYDINGDSELDFMDIRMFSQSAGWSDVRISKRNPHAISLANGTYRKLLEKISGKRLSRLDF